MFCICGFSWIHKSKKAISDVYNNSKTRIWDHSYFGIIMQITDERSRRMRIDRKFLTSRLYQRLSQLFWRGWLPLWSSQLYLIETKFKTSQANTPQNALKTKASIQLTFQLEKFNTQAYVAKRLLGMHSNVPRFKCPSCTWYALCTMKFLSVFPANTWISEKPRRSQFKTVNDRIMISSFKKKISLLELGLGHDVRWHVFQLIKVNLGPQFSQIYQGTKVYCLRIWYTVSNSCPGKGRSTREQIGPGFYWSRRNNNRVTSKVRWRRWKAQWIVKTTSWQYKSNKRISRVPLGTLGCA